MGFENWKPYQYKPSLVAAIVACAVFAILTLVACIEFFGAIRRRATLKKDKRQICTLIPFLIGAFAEFVGYIGRIYSSQHESEKGPFILQSILLLVAPALFAASIYMTLGRVIGDLNAAKFSLVPLRWLTKIFVVGDVFLFLLQGGGGGLIASKLLSSVKAGEHIIVAGLFLQIVFFGLFIAVMCLFQVRISRNPTELAVAMRNQPHRFRNWRTVLMSLNLMSLLILVRSIVRVIEFMQGHTGQIISHEVFLYVLDAIPMALVVLLFDLQNIGAFYAEYLAIVTRLGVGTVEEDSALSENKTLERLIC